MRSFCCRYLNRRRPTGGFYDPPPMLTRRPVRTGAPPTYGTLTGSQKTTLVVFDSGVAMRLSQQQDKSGCFCMSSPLVADV